MASRYINFGAYEKHLEKPRKELEDFASLLYDPISSPKQYIVTKLIIKEIYEKGAVLYKDLVKFIVDHEYTESIYYDALRKLRKFGLIHKKEKKYRLFNGFSKAFGIYSEQWEQIIKNATVREKEIIKL